MSQNVAPSDHLESLSATYTPIAWKRDWWLVQTHTLRDGFRERGALGHHSFWGATQM